MTADSATVARRAAARLAGATDLALPAQTETVLAAGGAASAPPLRFGAGGLELAAFLVTVAQFAWTLYHDLAKDAREAREAPPPATTRRALILRRLRIQAQAPLGLPAATRDTVFEAVLDEIEEITGLEPPADTRP